MLNVFSRFSAVAVLSFIALFCGAGTLPDGFVYVDMVIPDIKSELRYSGTDNFIGDRIDGYESSEVILGVAATEALRQVQEELAPFGLGLKIYDAYRPQRAVDHFVRWAQNTEDIRMKAKYYPRVEKKDLFAESYISYKSSHSRGSTVDLTIVDLKDPKAPELDMGSGFDMFSVISWPDYQRLSASQRANRLLLRQLMLKRGFVPYPREWWHFTLKNEPFPETYFDFPVK